MTFLGQLKAIKVSAAFIMGNKDMPAEKKAALLYEEIESIPVWPRVRSAKMHKNNRKNHGKRGENESI